jgi:glycosyltransferase involved in cell wall biosynthesis
MNIEYGGPNRFVNVTATAMFLYSKEGKLIIPSGAKQFNSHFGDPCPHVLKQLKITINGQCTIISENDLQEYIIVLDDLNQYLTKVDSPFYRHLITNLQTIHRAHTVVQTLDPNYYDLTIISPCVSNERDNYDISIVMTTYNRSRQTYYTLYSLEQSAIKRVQVIIVDDSTTDPIDIFLLKHFNLTIYYLKLKNKFWINPCVNYNFGFQFVKAPKMIIQNAEVCHIGDVMALVHDKILDQEYLVFDVNNLSQHQTLYDSEPTYENVMAKELMWYQHHQTYNRKLHFLTAITTSTFDRIKGFDYDFCMGSWYDDNELVWRIEAHNIQIVTVPHTNGIMGTHQWHISSSNDWDRNVIKNEELFRIKCEYFKRHQRFFMSTDYRLLEAYTKVPELFKMA